MFARFAASVLFALGLTLMASAPAVAKDSTEQQRAEVRKATQQVLKQLYRTSPSAKGAVASAAGYAVFSNFGMKILFAGGGKGAGIAVNNATRKEVFMKMVEVQAGLGFGAKKFGVVFIFETERALSEFVNSGWEFGGQATVAATDGKSGAAYQGAASVMPGVWMYQVTEKGLAAELTGKGTKYYKNDDLN